MSCKAPVPTMMSMHHFCLPPDYCPPILALPIAMEREWPAQGHLLCVNGDGSHFKSFRWTTSSSEPQVEESCSRFIFFSGVRDMSKFMNCTVSEVRVTPFSDILQQLLSLLCCGDWVHRQPWCLCVFPSVAFMSGKDAELSRKEGEADCLQLMAISCNILLSETQH
jgi:hypothetical protein